MNSASFWLLPETLTANLLLVDVFRLNVWMSLAPFLTRILLAAVCPLLCTASPESVVTETLTERARASMFTTSFCGVHAAGWTKVRARHLSSVISTGADSERVCGSWSRHNAACIAVTEASPENRSPLLATLSADSAGCFQSPWIAVSSSTMCTATPRSWRRADAFKAASGHAVRRVVMTTTLRCTCARGAVLSIPSSTVCIAAVPTAAPPTKRTFCRALSTNLLLTPCATVACVVADAAKLRTPTRDAAADSPR